MLTSWYILNIQTYTYCILNTLFAVYIYNVIYFIKQTYRTMHQLMLYTSMPFPALFPTRVWQLRLEPYMLQLLVPYGRCLPLGERTCPRPQTKTDTFQAVRRLHKTFAHLLSLALGKKPHSLGWKPFWPKNAIEWQCLKIRVLNDGKLL